MIESEDEDEDVDVTIWKESVVCKDEVGVIEGEPVVSMVYPLLNLRKYLKNLAVFQLIIASSQSKISINHATNTIWIR